MKKYLIIFCFIVLCAESLGYANNKEDNLGWRGALAGMDVALDAYRMSLREVNQILHLAYQRQLLKNSALLTKSMPNDWLEVFFRASRILSTLKEDSLPITIRILHAQLAHHFLEAARNSSPREWFSHVKAANDVLKQINEQVQYISKLVAPQGLYSEEFLDEEQAVQAISDAADNLQRNIMELNRAGRRRVGSGEKYPILVKLEISLRILLEKIAAASESGYQLGFTPRLTTPDLLEKISILDKRITEYDQLLQKFEAVSEIHIDLLEVRCLDAGSDSEEVVVDLQWQVVHELRDENAVTKYLHQPKAFARVSRQAMSLADGGSWEIEKDWQQRSFQGAQRPAYQDQIAFGAMYRYKVEIANWVGVAKMPVIAQVRCAPDTLQPPQKVLAQAFIQQAWRDDLSDITRSEKFYRYGDAIEISWQPSPNFGLPSKDEKQLAGKQLKEYHIFRTINDEEREEIAVVSAADVTYIDYPPEQRLRYGNKLTYIIAAVDREGTLALSEPSNEVMIEWNIWKELAFEGYFDYSNQHLEGMLGKLIQSMPDHINAAIGKWLNDGGTDEYPENLDKFWRHTDAHDKIAWYHKEMLLQRDGNSLCLEEGPQHYIQRDRIQMVLEIWLSQQPDQVISQPAHWWTTLTDGQRRTYLNGWWHKQNRDFQQFLLGTREEVSRERAYVPDGENKAPWDGLEIEALSPAVLHAWYNSFDPIEQRYLEDFWQGLAGVHKERIIQSWWSQQTISWRYAACFPDWHGLNNKEQAAYLKDGYDLLSGKVRLSFLPYVWLESLPWSEKSQMVPYAENQLRRWARNIRYGFFRPMDKVFGFHFRVVLIVWSILLIGAWLYWRAKKRNRFYGA